MKEVLNNHLFLWKLCFRTAPGYMIYFLYDAVRYQFIIFLEHVLGIRYLSLRFNFRCHSGSWILPIISTSP